MATYLAKFVEIGDRVDYTPGSAVSAGDVVNQNGLIGVATQDIAANTLGSLAVEGVFDVRKAASVSVTFAAGAVVYWDTSTEYAVAAQTANTVYFGRAVEASANAATSVRVKLDQKFDANEVASISYTIGTEAANVINVAMQLKNAAGTDLAVRAAVPFYLTSDANGDTIEGSGPDSWAIGTDGILIKNGGDSLISGMLISEADGDIDLNLTHAGADTFYINAILPNGRLATSGAITFDATT